MINWPDEYCKNFKGNQHCIKIDAYVPREFCIDVCRGQADAVEKNIREVFGQEQEQRPLKISPAWRKICQDCEQFDGCCRCKAMAAGSPGGRRPKLARVWAEGGLCPAGKWPAYEERP